MRKHRRLWDTYRFPGFCPSSTLQGIFGDPRARILRLNRRGKKPFAELAALSSEHGTIENGAESATWRVETIESTWRSRCAVSIAPDA